MSENKLIQCVDLMKVYEVGNNKIFALDGIDFEANQGDLISLMGPSGSGKSTLLHMIGTIDRPTSGRVWIDGVDVTELPETKLYEFRRDKIGFVFQFFNLATRLNAIENVTLPMMLAEKYKREEATEKAKLLLRLIGLPEERFKNTPRQLSAGQQQMVAMARSLANDPLFVLADEPTGNLDLESAARLISMIKSLNSYMKLTFIIVTHNPEVASVAPVIRFMRGGKLLDRPPDSYLAHRVARQDATSSPEKAELFSDLFDFEQGVTERRYLNGDLGDVEFERQMNRIEEIRRHIR